MRLIMGATTLDDTKMEKTNHIGDIHLNGHVKSGQRRPTTSRHNSARDGRKNSHAVRRSKSQATPRTDRSSSQSSHLAREAEDIVPDNLGILNEIKLGANGMEGLFQRKRSSINMLTDPRILDHLRKIHQQATTRGSTSSSDTVNSQTERDQLDEKVVVYNRKMQLDLFQLRKNSGRHYEGALRFYYEDDTQELTKAVKVNSNTTVRELVPVLMEKFNLENMDDGDSERRGIYEVVNGDEILLDKDERPLELALNAKSTPRFVLSEGPPSSSKHTRKPFDAYNAPSTGLDNSVNNSQNKDSVGQGGFVSPVVRRRNKNKTKEERQADRSKRRTWTGVVEEDSMSSSKTTPEMSPSAQIIASRRGRSLKKKDKSEGGDEKKRSRSASRHRRSFRFSFRKSKEVEELPDKSELSTEDRAPGILKIFGESVVPGANYKSVLATRDVTASEIVKQSLERYNLPSENSSNYVLCDVVGRFRVPSNSLEEPVWVTEHVRVIPNNERPMILMSLWKPQGGLSRRFELMGKSYFAGHSSFVDFNDNIDVTDGSISNVSFTSSQRQYNAQTTDSTSIEGYIIHPNQRLSGTTMSVTNTSAGSGIETPIRQPAEQPFFLTLRGYNTSNDYILYTINETAAMVGSDRLGKHTVDISLTAPDILPQHCWICKKPAENTTDLDSPDSPVVITLAPLTGAAVYVNNKPITRVTELCPGDLVAMGEHYVFLFKDPTISREIPRNLNWMSPRRQETERRNSISEMNNSVYDGETSVKSEHRAETLEEWQETRQREYEPEHIRLKISYDRDREDDLLDQCVTIMNPLEEGFPLTPAYLLCLCVEYSAVKFSQQETRGLLLKISSLVQSAAWERTKDLASHQINNTNIEECHVYLASLLPDMKPIIFWMANGLEMLHFLQHHLPTYIMDANMSLPSGTRGSLIGADNEVVAVLEEVVMYTFQQTVYYLTKTLYMVLAAILDSNPFTPSDEHSSAMDDIIDVFESTHQIVIKYKLHSDIVSQLFCYLFFFTNTSLFNTLMETGAGHKYYNWHKAIQIRANLDILENWACEKGLQEESEKYFSTFATAVNLLATPKHQLLHADWTTLRNDFPGLSPAQLQQLLGEYNLGRDKPRPRGWFPPPEEVEPALRKGEIMESFNSHPPLVLPTDDYVMDLSTHVSDPTFYEYLNTINTTFGVSDDDVDSGLCVGHTPSSSPKAETNKMPYPVTYEEDQVFTIDSDYRSRLSGGKRRSQSSSQYEHESEDSFVIGGRKPHHSTSDSYSSTPDIPPPRPHKTMNGIKTSTAAKPRKILHQYVNEVADDLTYTKVSIHRQQSLEKSEIMITRPPNLPPKQISRGYPQSKQMPQSPKSRTEDILGAIKMSASSIEKQKQKTWRRGSPSEPPIVPATWESLYNKRMSQKRASNHQNTNGNTNTAGNAMRTTPAISVTPAESSRSIPVLGPPLKVSGSDCKNETHYVDVHSAVPFSQHSVSSLKVMPLTTDDQNPPKSPSPRRKPPKPQPPPRMFTSESPSVPRMSSQVPSPRQRPSPVGKQSSRSGSEVSESEMDQYFHQETTLAEERRYSDDTPDVFVVDLAKTNKGLGLGLIDGMFTPLRASGIYVRTLVPGAPAHKDGRLKLGDRILAVNGISLVGADYQSAMKHIRSAGESLRFLVAKSDCTVAMKITASTC